MPFDQQFTITTSTGEKIPEVIVTWGVHHPKSRRGQIGWGTSIEMTAMLRLAELVEAGTISAAEMKANLVGLCEETAEIAEEADVIGRYGTWGEGCVPGCRTCAQAKPKFEAGYAERLAQTERAKDPAAYPYVVGKSSLHRASCHTVEEYVRPMKWEPDESDLRMFAHHDVVRSSCTALRHVLSVDETKQWIADHTGPAGGRHFRTCKICKPEVPA
jgi:hypothetical protein